MVFTTATTIAKKNPQRTDNIVQKEVFAQTYSWEKNDNEGEKTEYTMEFRVNICS